VLSALDNKLAKTVYENELFGFKTNSKEQRSENCVCASDSAEVMAIDRDMY